MERRKFVVGLGSLAAGASAVMGTGAITDSTMERGVKGRVAADGPNSAYIEVRPSSNAGNEEHVRFNPSTGEMQVYFGDIGSGGAGLNPDSRNYFDVVFFVENQNPSGNSSHGYFLWFEDVPSRLNFYVDSQDPDATSLVGKSNARQMDWGGEAQLPVGVCVDLIDSGLTAGDSLPWDEDDEFTMHIEKRNV
ncbi:hypothetical protein [Halorubellus litoreus]|uniref:DUF1102 domain-containing protein n=1 Tax=Halorubellus litoreus TaxID=755308 RepID=A0ABD5VFS3_9EURY